MDKFVVAISFGNYTDQGVSVAYRVDGQDWQFSNVTANSTYQFVSPSTTGVNLTVPTNAVQTFEIRGISSCAWGLGEGFGNIEFSITAYPGICLTDKQCYGNHHGQTYQWCHTSDTSPRAISIWGDEPELWNFSAHPAADIVVINLGTNDNNTVNNVTNDEFYDSYINLVDEVHYIWPSAQIILLSLWNGFSATGNTYAQGGAFITEIHDVYRYYLSSYDAPFVHYFNTTGIMQHNDIGPQYHPTDVGHIKLASHLLQYIQLMFGWQFGATGPEVQVQTLYWNDQENY
ncbi:MAG: hypothetical protein M1834_009239 [Cirrosporium novae-zelandiae]|nr:MAG: hypothetical protein M1834_009239 [Cirrosporium novae-zelandiae]